jgi:UDP-N-acetylmuramyl pentapeptide synthase
VVTGPAQYVSRLPEPGGLFVAFQGRNVDGHDLASHAVAGGALAVLAGRSVGMPAVVVDEVQTALGRLAPVLVDRADGDPAVLGIAPDTRYAVCELSARHVGDVAYFARLKRPGIGRRHVSEVASDVTVINDADNSSPASTSAALRTAVTPAKGRRLAVGLQSLALQFEVDGAMQDHANAERDGK